MNEQKRELVARLAAEEGFAGVRGCAYENGTLFFLFRPYRPAPCAGYGKINLSNYYIVSQQGYLGMKKLISRLGEAGVRAEEYKERGVKRLALQTGGFIGLNSLYYHEQYGSFVSIHALKTDFLCEADRPDQGAGCAGCKSCIAACPTGAIAPSGLDVRRCVRAHSNEKSIPEEYRGFIYQLLGCERCQSACPYNEAKTGTAYSFDLAEVIEGTHTKQIRSLVGTNYGRRRIVVGQAAIYAANTCYRPALSALEALAEDEFVGEAARWAVKILKKS